MVFQNNLLMGSGGQPSGHDIDQSCRFNDDDSATMTRTPGSSGNTNTWTLSFWVKRCLAVNLTGQKGIMSAGDGGGDTGPGDKRFDHIGWSSDQIQLNTFNGFGVSLYTTAEYRDRAAWYHVVWRYDDTQSTASDRCRLYVNGVLQTFTGTQFPDQNKGSSFNNAYLQRIVGTNWVTSRAMDGYLAEFVMIDGSSLAASSFGETNSDTGQWVAKDVSGLTFGTNGFHLKFQDSSALGDDTSGNGNDWSTSGLAAGDQVTDSPTNNFCVWNVNDTGSGTLSDGNLVLASTTDRSGTFGMDSGKWAWKITTAASGAFGVVQGSLTGTESTYSAGSGEVLEFQLDISAGTLEVSVDGGSYSSVATGLTSGPYLPLAKAACTADFGQSGFTRDDTDFNYLSTAGLDDPTIADPSAYFQTTLYTGNGSTQSIDQSENSSFEPDFVWIKNRDAADSHILTDAVRGATKVLNSDTTAAEVTDADTLTAFESNGFALGDDDKVNTNTEKYAAWQWLESATSAFDIVSYTGNATARTISHSLGVAPEMMLVKNLADTDNWAVYHASNTAAPATDYLVLNDYNATADDATIWNDTAPTSSVFSVGTSALTNGNTEAMIAYLFASVTGFSKMGSYTGNGNINGPFVPTSFRPAFFLLKNTAEGEAWYIFDDQRLGYNPNRTYLIPNTSAVEGTASADARDNDFSANGVKIRTTNGAMNSSGVVYVYAAFAQTPFKTANAR